MARSAARRVSPGPAARSVVVVRPRGRSAARRVNPGPAGRGVVVVCRPGRGAVRWVSPVPGPAVPRRGVGPSAVRPVSRGPGRAVPRPVDRGAVRVGPGTGRAAARRVSPVRPRRSGTGAREVEHPVPADPVRRRAGPHRPFRGRPVVVAAIPAVRPRRRDRSGRGLGCRPGRRAEARG
ncbi:hypothetical protein C6361_26335 [Plantactinospora sp. BC1]|nr:hypothetical protein C6361_26335 [Plantactinospora sp. BC1]